MIGVGCGGSKKSAEQAAAREAVSYTHLMVGTRSATEYGLASAYRLSHDLAAAGCTVVSLSLIHIYGGFSQLVELLSAGRDDRRVFDTLFSLYDFVRAHPFYNDWLDDKLAYYCEGVRAADSIWGRCILDYAKGALGHAASLLRRALALAAVSYTHLVCGTMPKGWRRGMRGVFLI